MTYFLVVILGVIAFIVGGETPSEKLCVSVMEWRALLDEALENNRPDSPQFAEHLADWSNRLYLQAEASKPDSPYRDQDRCALMEYCVLLCYIDAVDRSSGLNTVFNKEDHELMTSSPKMAFETFGQPTMAESWDHFASLWKEFGLRPVPSPFTFSKLAR